MKENKNWEYPFLNPELDVDSRVDDLISRLTIEEKISLIPASQSAVERLGIKRYFIGGEAAHGLARIGGKATVFPQPIGLACTWDKELLHKIGSVISDEARAYNKKRDRLHVWAPTIDMERDPRWGRTEEAYGEDPCLTGELSSELILGMQGEHPFYIKLSSAPKHFFGNNNENGRCECSSTIDERNMREYYLKPFEKAFKKGKASSMMTAYNSVNGIPCMIHPVVNDIVRDEWGFDGFVITDGGDFAHTVTHHKYYETHAETVAEALKRGVDCMLDDKGLVEDAIRAALALKILDESEMDVALKNIFRIRFRLGQFDPEELNPYSSIDASYICSDENSALAHKAACEAMVLLKNENNTLPINKDKVKKVAVIGQLANEVYSDYYCGEYPYKVTALEGIKSKFKGAEVVYHDACDSIKIKSLKNDSYVGIDDSNALKADFTADNAEVFKLTDWGWDCFTVKATSNNKFVTTDNFTNNQTEGQSGKQDENALTVSATDVHGWFVRELFNFVKKDDIFGINAWDGMPVHVIEDGTLHAVEGEGQNFSVDVVNNGIDEAVKIAKEADVAVVFVGNCPYINGKEDKDRPDIILPPMQEELIKAVYKANPNTVVVLTSSYPLAINWADENIPAILFSCHGGQEMGNAIADVLSGDYAPSGRLNMTWYKSVEQLSDIMDYDIINGKRTYMYFEGKPLYCFGHGLTYTTFDYSNLWVSSDKLAVGESLKITVDVKNTGEVASDEVVQLYVTVENPSVKRPIKELKDFKRVHIEPNQTKTVELTLAAEDLTFWDVETKSFCLEKGRYKIRIGDSSEGIRLEGVFVV